MLDDPVHAAAARAAAKAGAQLVQVLFVSGGDHFHVAILGIAYPSAQLKLTGLAIDEPAKPNPLHAPLNEEMKNHIARPPASFADASAPAQAGEQGKVLLASQLLKRPGRRPCVQQNQSGRIPRTPHSSRRDHQGAATLAVLNTPRELWFCLKLDLSMVFVLDNYDSFTYNLVQYLGELGAEVIVRRNDEVTPEEVEAMKPDRILLSPGPCTPHEAGILVPLIHHMAAKSPRTPILGVCLGHQAIGEAFGGHVVRAGTLMHGKTSAVRHDGRGIFSGLPTPITCTRYHSLIVDEQSLPGELEITARTGEANGVGGEVIMGLRHRTLPVEGVQFHPESVLTEGGHRMIQNFLEM